MSNKTINNSILGTITSSSTGGEWATVPMKIGALDYIAEIRFFTGGSEPTASQLDLAHSISNLTPAFKAEIEGHMLSAYLNARLDYLPNIGKTGYWRTWTHDDLPELKEPSQIWRVIEGINSIFVDERGEISFQFIPAFDQNHDFAVTFRNGELVECMLDG